MAATFLFQMPRYSRILVLLVGPLDSSSFSFRPRAPGARSAAGARGAGLRVPARSPSRLGLRGRERARGALEAARRDGIRAAPCGGSVELGRDAGVGGGAASARSSTPSGSRSCASCPSRTRSRTCSRWPRHSATRALRVYWSGSVAHLASAAGEERQLGPLRAVLLYAPSRGLSLRARKRASDLVLSFLVAPLAVGKLRDYLAARGEAIGPGEAWRQSSRRRSGAGSGEARTRPTAGPESPRWARLAPRIAPARGRVAVRATPTLGPEARVSNRSSRIWLDSRSAEDLPHLPARDATVREARVECEPRAAPGRSPRVLASRWLRSVLSRHRRRRRRSSSRTT